jgi:hypothetical protein
LNTEHTINALPSPLRHSADDPPGLLTYELADEQTLRVHLLEQVLVAAYPDPRERSRVTYWLGWLAYHMNTQPNGSALDMCWWQIPGWIGRWQFSLVRGLLVGLVGGLIGGLLLGVGYILWDGTDSGSGSWSGSSSG